MLLVAWFRCVEWLIYLPAGTFFFSLFVVWIFCQPLMSSVCDIYAAICVTSNTYESLPITAVCGSSSSSSSSSNTVGVGVVLLKHATRICVHRQYCLTVRHCFRSRQGQNTRGSSDHSAETLFKEQPTTISFGVLPKDRGHPKNIVVCCSLNRVSVLWSLPPLVSSPCRDRKQRRKVKPYKAVGGGSGCMFSSSNSSSSGNS